MLPLQVSRRVALILSRADKGEPEYRKAGVRIARMLVGVRRNTQDV